MKNIHKNKKGFTLVELMITIAIVGILSSVTIVSLQNGKTKKSLETASREVVAAIREAQNNALSGKGASATCTNYKFTYIQNSSDYSLGSVGACPVASYTLKNGVKFSNGGSFYFKIPFGTVENVSGGHSIHLNKGSGNDRYVCFTDQGSVFEQEGACP